MSKPFYIVLSNLIPEGKHLLKVQTAFNGTGRALIYNKKKTVMIEQGICKVIRKMMGKEPKRFFYAEIKDGVLIFGKEAKWAKW